MVVSYSSLVLLSLLASASYAHPAEQQKASHPAALVKRSTPTFDPGPGAQGGRIVTNDSTYWPYYVFESAPYNPSVWEINSTGDPLAPGLIFITPSDASNEPQVKQPGPGIYTDEGQLIWSGPTSVVDNFKWQYFHGQPTLTFWTGSSTKQANIGHGYGNYTFLNASYELVTVVCPRLNLTVPGNGPAPECQGDLHESYLTDRNTIVFSAYNTTPADLSSIGGPKDGWVFSGVFAEYDPLTGKQLFLWNSIDHVPINATHQPLLSTGRNQSNPFDYFHINSVVPVGDSHWLVNSRHTWTTYYLDSSGNIVWDLPGNTGGAFGPLPSNGTFRWQHFPRPHNVTEDTITFSLFNNNNQALDNSSSHPTSLLTYTLNLNGTGPAQLDRVIIPDDPYLFADSQGSYEAYLTTGDPGAEGEGHQFATFGQLPLMHEYDINNKLIWTGRAGPDNTVQLYRGYKAEWHGYPSTTPSLVVRDAGNGTKGYVSWNGATDIQGWNVYLSPSETDLVKVGEVGWKGFETVFDLPSSSNSSSGSGWAYVQVAAVVGGREAALSSVVALSG